jgi:hypothetical protein
MHADLLLYHRLLRCFDHGTLGPCCIYIRFFYYFSKLTEGRNPVLIVNAGQNLLGIIIARRAQRKHCAIPSKDISLCLSPVLWPTVSFDLPRS